MEIVNKKILVISAHPDDETLGCGGTIAKLSKNNVVHLTRFTNGVSAREDVIDKKNLPATIYKRITAVNSVYPILCRNNDFCKTHSLKYDDNRLDNYNRLDIIKDIEKLKSEIQPDIVFTHFKDCLNIDHQILSYCTYVAFRPQPQEKNVTILEYEVSSSTEYSQSSFNPNIFVDISETFELKIKALQCYDQEMRDFPHPRSYDMVENKAKYWGSHIGVMMAEGFVCRKMLL